MKQFCPKAKLYSRRRSSRIAAALSLKSEEDIAAEKKYLRAAITPVRDGTSTYDDHNVGVGKVGPFQSLSRKVL